MAIEPKSIQKEYLDLIAKISEHVKIPKITDIYVPTSNKGGISCQKNAFGAMILEDTYVGIIYLNLTDDAFVGVEINPETYIGKDPAEIAMDFLSTNEIKKTLALGAINSISQFVLQKSNYNFEPSQDSLGGLNPTQGDKLGMVGFFPPLVRQLKELEIPLTIIEKNESLVSENKFWKVTLDPAELNDKNKVLCTSTVVLNETVDEIVKNCSSAEKISIVGPTGGYLPDPLFSRGISAVGGSKINDAKLFLELMKTNQRWGPATLKYIITKDNYPGLDRLLEKINS